MPVKMEVNSAVQVPLNWPLFRLSASLQASANDAFASSSDSCHKIIQLHKLSKDCECMRVVDVIQ